MYVSVYLMCFIGFLSGILFSFVSLIIISIWFNSKKKR